LEQQPAGRREYRSVVVQEEAGEEGESKKAHAGKEKIEKVEKKIPVTKMPTFVAPQLAKLMKAPPVGSDWVHEVKFDGYRMQMRVDGGKARLRTRKGLDWTERFPEIAKEGRALPDCIIDGEICALNREGSSDFGLLQNALSDHKTGGLIFYLFDCLFAQGHDLRQEPLGERKHVLEQILKHARGSRRLKFVPHFTQSGEAMLTAACQMDLEGVISKKLDTPYFSGRGDSWTKSKCRGGQEVVIGAWRGTAMTLRSLLVGVHKGGEFVYMGRVGTGYNAKNATELLQKLRPLKRKTSPFDEARSDPDVNWVEPKLVAEIEFENVTQDGLFRQAAFKGLRQDKPAESIVPEIPADAPQEEKRKMAAKPKAAKAADKGDTILGIKISHPEKELWPKSKRCPAVTKRDLARYMADAAQKMLPHIANRPISVVRTPDGIGGQVFFQRHELKGTAAPVLAIKVKGEAQPYLGVDTDRALVALAQQGVTEIHPWGCKEGDPETPERIIIDLDPAPDVPFSRVIEGARELRKRLTALGFKPFVKTTGGKGLHVVIAVKGTDWPGAKAFAKAIALQLETDMPDRYTTTIAKKARNGKIFIDYLRNDKTSTGVAPWSPRAREGATIAVPLDWKELTAKLDPKKFTIPTSAKLLKKADPWAGLARSAKPIAAAMKKITKQ
jgi:bifunctional non-homologous end joining protein LigD